MALFSLHFLDNFLHFSLKLFFLGILATNPPTPPIPAPLHFWVYDYLSVESPKGKSGINVFSGCVFINTFCRPFLWTLFVDTFMDIFCDCFGDTLLWTLFVNTI